MISLSSLSKRLTGKVALLHSGYGGGQYVGRVVGVKTGDETRMPVLVFAGTMRYQPRGSTGGLGYHCYWKEYHVDDKPLELHLKERDRLYSLGRTINSDNLPKREPINPEDPQLIGNLTGRERRLRPLYEGSELVLVR